jgi:hypothetical protein
MGLTYTTAAQRDVSERSDELSIARSDFSRQAVARVTSGCGVSFAIALAYFGRISVPQWGKRARRVFGTPSI